MKKFLLVFSIALLATAATAWIPVRRSNDLGIQRAEFGIPMIVFRAQTDGMASSFKSDLAGISMNLFVFLTVAVAGMSIYDMRKGAKLTHPRLP